LSKKAEEIGLANEVVGVASNSPAGHKRMILVNNKLHQLPSKAIDLFKKREPFTKRLYKYLIKDLQTPKIDLSQWGGDISCYDFVNHRMGSEIADYLIDPLCRGITAGDSKKLSLTALFPNMIKGEQETGSLVRGTIMSAQESGSKKYHSSDLAMWAKTNRWSVYSFKDGIQTLPNRLCDYMIGLDGNPIEIYNESTVNKLEFNETTNKALISISTKEENDVMIEADQVFSSIPAQKLSSILSKTRYSELCDQLNSIESVHMACVNLEFKGKVIPDDSGFGFLVPSREESKILGIVYDSCVFPHFTAGHDITLITVFAVIVYLN
jgi:oxygen-dependent protoporphyrinogen oxidase